LIDYSKKLNFIGEYGEELYQERRSEIQLDNLNLLYVAMTRAVEQLYIVTEKKNKSNDLSNARFYSDFFIDFLKSKDRWNDEEFSYDFGNSKRNVLKEKKSQKEKFTYQEIFISLPWNNRNISIVANSSKLWDTAQETAINHGNLIHEIFSKIITKNDVEIVISQYVFEGIVTKKESEVIKKTIYDVVEHPLLKQYFASDVLVFNERELISNNKERQIPDRVVIIKGKAVIIDYKTGKPKEIHKQQVEKYKETLIEVGYNIEETLLIYIDSKIIIKILTNW